MRVIELRKASIFRISLFCTFFSIRDPEEVMLLSAPRRLPMYSTRNDLYVRY